MFAHVYTKQLDALFETSNDVLGAYHISVSFIPVDIFHSIAQCGGANILFLYRMYISEVTLSLV